MPAVFNGGAWLSTGKINGRNGIAAKRRMGSDQMKIDSPQQLEIAIDNAGSVSALLIRPANARACFVFAHGAGAGMTQIGRAHV